MMKRLLSVFALCLVFLTMLVCPVFATEEKQLVIDETMTLSEDEIATLSAKLKEYGDKHNMDFVVIATMDIADGYSVQAYADDLYDYLGYGRGDDYSGALLLHCPTTRDWYISTCGTAIDVFTDAKIAAIGDDITPYLADGDFFGAYMEFAEQCDAANTHAPLAWYWIVVALVIGLVIAWIVVSSMKGQLKTVRSKTVADDYMRADSMVVSVSNDVFLFRHVDRRAKPKNNSSSTHTSSSGRTHGGGGGKY